MGSPVAPYSLESLSELLFDAVGSIVQMIINYELKFDTPLLLWGH